MTIQRIVVVTGLVMLCLGCEQKPAEPLVSCSDAQTTSTVQKLFLQAVAEGLPIDAGSKAAVTERINASFKISLDGIRTSARDDSVSKFTCDAELKLQPPQSVLQKLASNPLAQPLLRESGIRVEPDGLISSVQYTSQPTDDKKQLYVQLSGHEHLVQVAAFAAATAHTDAVAAESTKTQMSPPNAAASAPQVPTPVVPAEEDPICKGLDMTIVPDQMECLDRKYKQADSDLNATYKSLMSSLPEDRKAALRTEQRAWVSEKTKACADAGKEFAGGQMEGVVSLDCQVQQTEKRLEYLKRFK